MRHYFYACRNWIPQNISDDLQKILLTVDNLHAYVGRPHVGNPGKPLFVTCYKSSAVVLRAVKYEVNMVVHKAKSQYVHLVGKGKHRHSVHPENVVVHILEDNPSCQPVSTDVPVIFLHAAKLQYFSGICKPRVVVFNVSVLKVNVLNISDLSKQRFP